MDQKAVKKKNKFKKYSTLLLLFSSVQVMGKTAEKTENKDNESKIDAQTTSDIQVASLKGNKKNGKKVIEKVKLEEDNEEYDEIGLAGYEADYITVDLEGYGDKKLNDFINRKVEAVNRSQSVAKEYSNTKNNRDNIQNSWFYTTLKEQEVPKISDNGNGTSSSASIKEKYDDLNIVIPPTDDSFITSDKRIQNNVYAGYNKAFSFNSNQAKVEEIPVVNMTEEMVPNEHNLVTSLRRVDISSYPNAVYNVERGASDEILNNFNAVENTANNNVMFITSDNSSTANYTKINQVAAISDNSEGSIVWLAAPNQGSLSSSFDIFDNTGAVTVVTLNGEKGSVVYLTDDIADSGNVTRKTSSGGNYAYVNSRGRVILYGKNNTFVVGNNPNAKLYLSNPLTGGGMGNDITLDGEENVGFAIYKPLTVIYSPSGSGSRYRKYIQLNGQNGIFAYIDDKTQGYSEMKGVNIGISGKNNDGVILKNGIFNLINGSVNVNASTTGQSDLFFVTGNGNFTTNVSPDISGAGVRVLTVVGSNARSTMYDNTINLKGPTKSIGAIIIDNNNTRFFNTTLALSSSSGVYMKNSIMSRDTSNSPTPSPIDLIIYGRANYELSQDNGYFMYLDNSKGYANITTGTKKNSYLQENEGFVLKNNSSLDLGGMKFYLSVGAALFDIDRTSSLNIVNTTNPFTVTMINSALYRITHRTLDLRNGLPNITNAGLISVSMLSDDPIMRGYFVDTRLSYLNPVTFMNSGNAPVVKSTSPDGKVSKIPGTIALLEVSNLLLDEPVNLDTVGGTLGHIRIYNSNLTNDVNNSITGTKNNQMGLYSKYHNIQYRDIYYAHGPNYEYTEADVLAYNTLTNNGTINLSGDKTYGILSVNGNSVNTGNISVNSNSFGQVSTGDKISKMTNSGNITVGENSAGMVLNNTGTGSVIFENTGIINLNGKGSIGMHSTNPANIGVNKGTININSTSGYLTPTVGLYHNSINDGTINGIDYAVGMYGENLGTTGNSDITLGNNSTGIQITGGNLNVNGKINVGTDSVAIYNTSSNSTVNSNLTGHTVNQSSFGVINDGVTNGTVNINGDMTLTDNSVAVANKSNNKNLTVNSGATLKTSGNKNIVLWGGNKVNNNGVIDLSKGNDNIGIYSRYNGEMSNTKTGSIIVGEKSIGMFTSDGKIINDGNITVNGKNSIGMYSEGREAVNNGDINLNGDNTIGIYGNNNAKITNNGTIKTTGTGKQIIGVLLDNNSELINNGQINIDSEGGYATFKMNGSVIKNYGSINVGSKTRTDETDDSKPDYFVKGASVPPVTVQTTERHRDNTIAEYIDTSGINFTRPVEGLAGTNIKNSDLLIGSEAADYTNEKEILIDNDSYDLYNQVIKKNLGIIDYDTYSGSLTFRTETGYNSDGTINSLKLVKKDYKEFHDAENDPDGSTYGVLSGLEERYSMNDVNSEEKRFFNKINSIGNNELEVFAQAVDQIKGNIYASKDKRTHDLLKVMDDEFEDLKKWENTDGQQNKIKTFTSAKRYTSESNGIDDYRNNSFGAAYLHENKSNTGKSENGFYAGILVNRTKFKDLMSSEEEDVMGKFGIYRATPLNKKGDLRWNFDIGSFVSRREVNRNLYIVDEVTSNKTRYSSYGITLNNSLEKKTDMTPSTKLVTSAGLDLTYGRSNGFSEDGVFRLEAQGNNFTSVKPNVYVGIENEKTGKVYKLKTEFGVKYSTELGDLSETKLKLQGTNSEYRLRGEKNEKNNVVLATSLDLTKGNRLGLNLNGEYNITNKNGKIGLGIRASF